MSETDQGEQSTLLAFRKELKDALHKPQHSKIPLFIAALAALLSIISLADTETDKIAMSAHIESANKFAYFQAKNIRHTDTEIAARLFEKLDAPKLAAYWQEKANRYSDEKLEIFKKARAQEKIRKNALAKGDYYKVGVTLMQIAIVLASASMVVGGGSLFAMSLILTLVSLVYSLNGAVMLYDIPTNPSGFMDWGEGMLQQFQKTMT
ncbi:MAG: DUF4337 domain-containing protein [bacterium]|nr:DUF4337 domain-containing protein [bacterium]